MSSTLYFIYPIVGIFEDTETESILDFRALNTKLWSKLTFDSCYFSYEYVMLS